MKKKMWINILLAFVALMLLIFTVPVLLDLIKKAPDCFLIIESQKNIIDEIIAGSSSCPIKDLEIHKNLLLEYQWIISSSILNLIFHLLAFSAVITVMVISNKSELKNLFPNFKRKLAERKKNSNARKVAKAQKTIEKLTNENKEQ